jgi:hypothetical protein
MLRSDADVYVDTGEDNDNPLVGGWQRNAEGERVNS